MLIITFMYNLGHLDTQVKPKKATFVSMVAMKQWILVEWTLLPIKNMIFSFDQTQLILEQGIIFHSSLVIEQPPRRVGNFF